MQSSIKGVFPILLTPFNLKGSIDFEDLEKLTRYYVDSGVDGLACLGEVSESQWMEEKERRSILRKVMDCVSGKIPVVSGVGRETDRSTVEAAEYAQEIGASALLLAPQKKPDATEEEVLGRFRAVDRVAEKEIIILDNPTLGFSRLSIPLIERILGDCSMVTGIKVEDQPSQEKIAALRKAFGKELAIYGATNGRNLYWEMELGIDGILTSAPVPFHLVELWKLYRSGNKERALDLFLKTLPLAVYTPERTVAVKKEILKLLGIFKESTVRIPGGDLPDHMKKDVAAMLDWTGRMTESFTQGKYA